VIRGCVSKDSCSYCELNPKGQYIVTFDPIDGGTVIESNFSVASIFGIWNTKDIIGCTGRELAGAALSIYGSRTSALIYNPFSGSVEEIGLIKRGKKPSKWVVVTPKCDILPKAKTFSPEGAKSCFEN
jgi:fructose-1,6-bisphosphatase